MFSKGFILTLRVRMLRKVLGCLFTLIATDHLNENGRRGDNDQNNNDIFKMIGKVYIIGLQDGSI